MAERSRRKKSGKKSSDMDGDPAEVPRKKKKKRRSGREPEPEFASTHGQVVMCPTCDAAVEHQPDDRIIYCPYCDEKIKLGGDGGTSGKKRRSGREGATNESRRSRRMPQKPQEMPIGLKIGLAAFCVAILVFIGILVSKGGSGSAGEAEDPNKIVAEAKEIRNEAYRLKRSYESLKSTSDRHAVVEAWRKAMDKFSEAQKKYEYVWNTYGKDKNSEDEQALPGYEWLDEEIASLMQDIYYLQKDKPLE